MLTILTQLRLTLTVRRAMDATAKLYILYIPRSHVPHVSWIFEYFCLRLIMSFLSTTPLHLVLCCNSLSGFSFFFISTNLFIIIQSCLVFFFHLPFPSYSVIILCSISWFSYIVRTCLFSLSSLLSFSLPLLIIFCISACILYHLLTVLILFQSITLSFTYTNLTSSNAN